MSQGRFDLIVDCVREESVMGHFNFLLKPETEEGVSPKLMDPMCLTTPILNLPTFYLAVRVSLAVSNRQLDFRSMRMPL